MQQIPIDDKKSLHSFGDGTRYGRTILKGSRSFASVELKSNIPAALLAVKLIFEKRLPLLSSIPCVLIHEPTAGIRSNNSPAWRVVKEISKKLLSSPHIPYVYGQVVSASLVSLSVLFLAIYWTTTAGKG